MADLESNTEIVAETVKAGEYEAYLARPATGENLPGVVIIHEIFGLNDNIRDIAGRFAQAGYVGLAVDLFSKGRNRPLCVMSTVRDVLFNLRESGHLGSLDGATRFLQEQSQVNGQRIGLIGFCMGGGYALAYAMHSHEIKAASVFYAANPKPIEAIIEACPIAGSYPDKDFTAKPGRRLDEILTASQRPHDIKIYPNTRHSFFNDRGRAYNAEAAADAWQRTLHFFEEHIR